MSESKCEVCKHTPDAADALLSEEEIASRLQDLVLWERVEGSVSLISRSFVAKTFQHAMNFITEVGHIAEREGHHPDLHLTSYRNVQVTLYSHGAGGLTDVDFDLARKIDQEISVVYSPKWLKENPQAEFTAHRL